MTIPVMSPVKLAEPKTLQMLGQDGRYHVYAIPAGAVAMQLPKTLITYERNNDKSLNLRCKATTYVWVEDLELACRNINGIMVYRWHIGMNSPKRSYLSTKLFYVEKLRDKVLTSMNHGYVEPVRRKATTAEARSLIKHNPIISPAYGQLSNAPHPVVVSASGHIDLGEKKTDSRLIKTVITRKGKSVTTSTIDTTKGVAPNGKDGGRYITDGTRIGRRWYSDDAYRVMKMGME